MVCHPLRSKSDRAFLCTRDIFVHEHHVVYATHREYGAFFILWFRNEIVYWQPVQPLIVIVRRRESQAASIHCLSWGWWVANGHPYLQAMKGTVLSQAFNSAAIRRLTSVFFDSSYNIISFFWFSPLPCHVLDESSMGYHIRHEPHQ